MPPKPAEEEEPEEPEEGSVPVPPCLAWTDLKKTDATEFVRLGTAEEAIQFVVEKFDLKDFESNAKSTILLDLYLWTLSFCKEAGLSEEKTSALFTIMKRLHEHSKDHDDVLSAFNLFKQMLLQHSLANTQGCVELYSPTEVKMITQFVHTTFLQHYRLYRFANTRDQEKDQFSTCLFVNTAPAPPPLLAGKVDEEKKAVQEQVAEEKPDDKEAKEEVAKEEKKVGRWG
mmetsp:Transcript_5374/g.18973  ORF Transcript_5374/g.18973 Transcript_5374/m.18973 type:complete len:229 (-) Transcript_5374:71-757(-)